MISYDQFKEIEMRVGVVLAAERVPDTDKLLKLLVDVGEEEPRQIVSGIAEYISPDDMIGKAYPFVTNLEPRTIRGLESNGMILGVSGKSNEKFSLLTPVDDVLPGSLLG